MSSNWSEELRCPSARALGHGGTRLGWRANMRGASLMAREWIDLLLDPGAFQEVGIFSAMNIYAPKCVNG